MRAEFDTYVTADTALVTTAETVVATLTGVATNRPGQTLNFTGSVTLVAGTSTTAFTFRVRADSLTGTVIGEAPVDAIEVAVGSVETHTIDVTDTAPGEFSGRTYVLTVQQTGAAANGNVSQAALHGVVKP